MHGNDDLILTVNRTHEEAVSRMISGLESRIKTALQWYDQLSLKARMSLGLAQERVEKLKQNGIGDLAYWDMSKDQREKKVRGIIHQLKDIDNLVGNAEAEFFIDTPKPSFVQIEKPRTGGLPFFSTPSLPAEPTGVEAGPHSSAEMLDRRPVVGLDTPFAPDERSPIRDFGDEPLSAGVTTQEESGFNLDWLPKMLKEVAGAYGETQRQRIATQSMIAQASGPVPTATLQPLAPRVPQKEFPWMWLLLGVGIFGLVGVAVVARR